MRWLLRGQAAVIVAVAAGACSLGVPDNHVVSGSEPASMPLSERTSASNSAIVAEQEPSTVVEANATDEVGAENPSMPCPVSEVDYGFWEETGGVAGEYPVWMSSRGEGIWDESRLGPIILPPDEEPTLFERGYLSKTLIFVDRAVDGDLTITGERIQDGSPVYFFSDSNSTRLSDTTLQLLGAPPISKRIEFANETNRSPNPPGKATHGMGVIYTGPGCWRFTFRIAEFETEVFKSFVGDQDAG